MPFFHHVMRCSMLLICCFSASACVMKCGDYNYLDFTPTSGVRVVKLFTPTLGGLRGAKPFPALYEISREKYQIKLRTDETTYGPTIVMTIESQEPMTLKITTSPLSAVGIYCFSYTELNSSLKFSWLDETGCSENQSIAVIVRNANGEEVATETLSFNVIPNGRFCIKDSI